MQQMRGKKKRNKKENKNKRTGLDAGLADVDGNNLSHLLFKFGGGIGCRRCSTRVRIAKTKVLMSLRFFLCEEGMNSFDLFP